MILNVLADRYASPDMKAVWDPAGKIMAERRLWLAVLESQRQSGLDVSAEVVADYRGVLEVVDLEQIELLERSLKHDVKARIEAFNDLAGHEAIHLGMTSRDLTENVEQMQVRQSLELVRDRVVASLRRLAAAAAEHSGLVVTGRSHNVPAQATTMGKRFASAGEELLMGLDRLEALLTRYPLRGIKGPVGTQQDQLELIGSGGAAALDADVASALGFESTMGSVGQVYPRSLDLDVVSTLTQLAASPSNLTITLRLMAGHDLATEGFVQGQVGSSAMPHKMNARTSERIHGFKVILAGHLAMAAGLAGEQWNEGDVSCSVVRRVMLPDAFFATDGLFQSFLTVLDNLGFFPAVIDAELDANLPFLATTRLLVVAVQEGMGRETAHDVIKGHAVATALDRRAGESGTGLFERLAADEAFPLDRAAIDAAVGDAGSFTGRSAEQVDAFVAAVEEVVARYPAAAEYMPAPIL